MNKWYTKYLKPLKVGNYQKYFDAFKKIKFSEFSFFSSIPRFSVKEQTFFAKRLSFLIKAGVPILESLYIIRKQAKSKSKIKVFDKVISDISNGQYLATSLARFNGVFGDFAINIIKVGESSGILSQNLSYLAEELKKKQALSRKVMSALFYPIIITIATFGITGFLVMYIFPKILPIFQGLNADMPQSTRIIIFITDIIRDYGIYIFIGIIIFIISFSIARRRIPAVRFALDGFILRIPLVGKIIKNYNLANICRTLGLLLKSGISVNESLLIASDTTENTQYKKSLRDIAHGVIKGKNISELLECSPELFQDMTWHMIAIGEKSGNLSDTLTYLAELYEDDFEDLTKNLSTSIEPILMMVMGLIVGFVAVSVITPIYEITQNIKR